MENTAKVNGTSRKAIWSIIGLIILYTMNTVRVSFASTLLLQADKFLGGPNTFSTFITFSTIIECTLVPFYLKLNAGYKTRRILLMLGGVIFAVDFILITVLSNMVAIQWVFLLVALSSGLIKVTSFSYINEVAGPKESAKWIGINGTVGSLSKVIILGLGVAIDAASYRLASGIMSALIVAATILIIVCSPKETGYSTKKTSSSEDFKFLPTLFFSLTLGSLLSALTFATNKKMPWGSTGNLILMAVFVISIVATVMYTKKLGNKAPLPLPVFKSKTFVLLMILVILTTAVTTCFAAFPSLYLQKAMGTGATAATVLSLMFMPVPFFLAPYVSKSIVKDKSAKKWIAINGAVCTALGIFAAIVFSPAISVFVVYAWGLVSGISNVITGTGMPAAITKTTPEDIAVYGSPVLALLNPFGASLGTAVVMGLFQSRGAEAAKTPVFLAVTVLGVIMMILSMMLPAAQKSEE